ncbi:DM13 domain-containing protein [Rhizohabitans arisaemae]|uniref:DM13 domain-containing protein n=1 Tax=Rhizohabitans arisaemae TaxID=2720610 RepID=UPI0024B0E625|nr:DM13 domain-containing protein [Rhizohabitans arisaemae]
MKVKQLLRSPVTWVVLVVLAGAFAYAMYLFQPWRIFTTVTVNEALPTATAPPEQRPPQSGSTDAPSKPPAAEPEVLATGSFITHEHGTTGQVRVLKLADGSRVLRIENLDTSDGPDLKVWLSDQPVKEGLAGWKVFDDGKYVELGDLKGNKGNANYAIPPGTDLDSLKSVSIWCKRFAVSFGAAALKSA